MFACHVQKRTRPPLGNQESVDHFQRQDNAFDTTPRTAFEAHSRQWPGSKIYGQRNGANNASIKDLKRHQKEPRKLHNLAQSSNQQGEDNRLIKLFEDNSSRGSDSKCLNTPRSLPPSRTFLPPHTNYSFLRPVSFNKNFLPS